LSGYNVALLLEVLGFQTGECIDKSIQIDADGHLLDLLFELLLDLLGAVAGQQKVHLFIFCTFFDLI